MNIPSNYDEFIGNKMIIFEFKKWWKNYKIDKTKYIVLLTGLSGIGKTLLVNIFCELNDLELNNFSYFDNKNLNKFKEDLKNLYNSQTILEIMYGKKTCILIDNIDNYSSDKKCIQDIVKIIINSKIKKLTFIISQINLDKFFNKKKNIKIFNFKKPSFNDIENYLINIGLSHKFLLKDNIINYIYNNTNGDIRLINQLINNLLSFINIKKINIDNNKFLTINIEDINILLSNKDIDYQLYDLVNKLLFNKNTISENINYVMNDTYYLPSILYDNLSMLIKNKKYSLKIYNKILENIILGEYINEKTFENQNNLTIEYYSFINSCYINYYFAPMNSLPIKFSILMNKLLKISNTKKYINNLLIKLPKEIKLNTLSLYIEINNYINKKIDKEKILIEYFESIDIDYKKLIKFL